MSPATKVCLAPTANGKNDAEQGEPAPPSPPERDKHYDTDDDTCYLGSDCGEASEDHKRLSFNVSTVRSIGLSHVLRASRSRGSQRAMSSMPLRLKLRLVSVCEPERGMRQGSHPSCE